MKLGSEWDWHTRCYRWPSKTVIRSVIAGIDADEMDRIVGKWLFENSRKDIGDEWEIALDGKVMTGAWAAENDKVILFAAVTHRDSVTIAQAGAPAETNEITHASGLLKAIDALGIPAGDEVLVTLDAVHTGRETAREIRKRKHLDYLMNVEGNRPGLPAEVFAKLAALTLGEPDDVIIERTRGRVRKWSHSTGEQGNCPDDHQQEGSEDDRIRREQEHKEPLGNREQEPPRPFSMSGSGCCILWC